MVWCNNFNVVTVSQEASQAPILCSMVALAPALRQECFILFFYVSTVSPMVLQVCGPSNLTWLSRAYNGSPVNCTESCLAVECVLLERDGEGSGLSNKES